MRGKLSDQDLTDYALNELEAHERLYLESMLAVSEECRADVYDMLEMGQLLEEGFEREALAEGDFALNESQRGDLLSIRRRPLIPMRNAAAALASAACLGLILTHPSLWPTRNTAVKVAQVSSRVADAVTQTVGSVQAAGMTGSLDSFRALVDEPAKWMPEAGTVCTPPQWLDIDAQPMSAMGMPDLGGMAY